MKLKRVIIVGLIAVLCCTVLFVSCDKKEKEPDGLNLAVMSYNIRQDTTTDIEERDWDYRKGLLVDHIKEQSPDILCMQEVQKNQNTYIDNSLTDYNVIWYSRKVDNSQEGLSIAYKKDKFELISEDMFWLSPTPNKESKGFGAMFLRICVHAVLKNLETNDEISVYCVHLEVTSESSRQKEIEMIVDRVKKEKTGNASRHFIVCGDFNTTKKSDCYATIAEELNCTQEVAKVTDTGISYQDFGGDKLSFKDTIDFIFADKDGTYVKEFDILQEHKEIDGKSVYYSDHYAVISKLILYSPVGPSEG